MSKAKAPTYKQMVIIPSRPKARAKVRTYMISFDARDEDYDYTKIRKAMKQLRTKYGAILVVRKLRSQWVVKMEGATPEKLRNHLAQFLGTDFGIIVNIVSTKRKSWSELGTSDKII